MLPSFVVAAVVAQAVLAVLGYRIVNCWLPLVPGAVAYLRLRLSPKRAGEARPSMPGGGSG